jgi:hypothetical protein
MVQDPGSQIAERGREAWAISHAVASRLDIVRGD